MNGAGPPGIPEFFGRLLLWTLAVFGVMMLIMLCAGIIR
jgi:hypothetical protein